MRVKYLLKVLFPVSRLTVDFAAFLHKPSNHLVCPGSRTSSGVLWLPEALPQRSLSVRMLQENAASPHLTLLLCDSDDWIRAHLWCFCTLPCSTHQKISFPFIKTCPGVNTSLTLPCVTSCIISIWRSRTNRKVILWAIMYFMAAWTSQLCLYLSDLFPSPLCNTHLWRNLRLKHGIISRPSSLNGTDPRSQLRVREMQSWNVP